MELLPNRLRFPQEVLSKSERAQIVLDIYKQVRYSSKHLQIAKIEAVWKSFQCL